MVNSKFINFSLNFELNKLLNNPKKFSIEKEHGDIIKNVLIMPPRLISNIGYTITFLILTDGSLFALDYTLPCRGLSKYNKSEIYNYAISRSDYVSVF
jgi:hypothetical protein